jgi:polysaccharide biosynthesis transport protein
LELSAYLQLLRRWWWTLLLAAWVAGLIGFLLASQIPASYEAQARMLVGPINTDRATVQASGSLAQTYAELATTEPQLTAVIDRLQLPMSPGELAGTFSVTANPTTRFLAIRVVQGDPETAAAIANAIGEELVATAAAAPGGRPEGELTLIDPADPPLGATGPNVSMMALLAGGAGLLLAGMIAATVEYLSDTVKGRYDLAELTGKTVLGEVAMGQGYSGTPIQPLIVEAEPESRTALGYRLLVTRLPLGAGDNRIKSLLIVPSQAGDLSGEFAANLGAVLVRSGRSVTLIDADDLEAQVSRLYDVSGRVGLGELLGIPTSVLERQALDDVKMARAPGMDLIPYGNRDATLMQEEMARHLLTVATARTDLVVLSGAPIHRSASSLLWARTVDAVVLVARAEATRTENIRSAVESLSLVNANVIGTVLLERRAGYGRKRSRAIHPPASRAGRGAGRAGQRGQLVKPGAKPGTDGQSVRATVVERAPDERQERHADQPAVGGKNVG